MKAAVFVAILAGAYAAEELMLKPLKLKKKDNVFCMSGHIAPSVFIAGYQKAGSSSLWTDMMRNMDLAKAHPVGQEEQFREKEVSYFHNEDRYKQGRNFYLKHFPECKEYGANQKVIDGSPNAIYQSWMMESAPIADVKIPAIERMKQFYGDDLSKKIKFVVIVRDPANRMESSYYHFHEGKYRNFDGYVDASLEKAKNWTYHGGTAVPSPNLYWPSMYARHLKEWLKEYDPSQFAVVTLQQYKEHPQKTLEFISKRLGIEARAVAFKEASTVENARMHRSMSAETRRKLNEFFAPMDKELSDLVKEHQVGYGEASVTGKVPGVLLQTGEQQIIGEDYYDPEAFDVAEMDQHIHFMMPAVEESLKKEYGH